jgi:hypothetical protein
MSWREQFREDNRLLLQLLGGWRVHVYFYAAALTFAFQIADRWRECAGSASCGLSLIKGAIWALAWPFYWINYATAVVLFHPGRW